MLTAAETVNVLTDLLGADAFSATLDDERHLLITATSASAWPCLTAALDAAGVQWVQGYPRTVEVVVLDLDA
jgi:hypothetical protein